MKNKKEKIEKIKKYKEKKEKQMKKFFKEFKVFITRGNVLDMAVGVIVGGAFTAIVTALTSHILQPLINWIIYLISGSQGSLDSVYTFLVGDASDLANAIYIDWGAFISAIINFLLIALVLFTVVKTINKVQEGSEKLTKDYKRLTKEDRKELKKRGISIFDAERVKAYVKEKDKLAAEKAEEEKRLAEEQAKKDREANPTETDLLKKIIVLLEEKK